MTAHVQDSNKLASALEDPESGSPTITREQHVFGSAYGLVAGVAFAIALWGWDGFQLSQAHALFPWLKLLIGILLSGIVGAIAGGIVARQERWIYQFLTWIATGGILAWISVYLPLEIAPFVSRLLEPELNGMLNYHTGGGYVARFWLSAIWIVIFLSLAGIFQSTLVDSVVFSASIFGRTFPFLVCAILAAVGGVMPDDLINSHFRKGVLAADTPIQFILDNQGKDVDPALARQFHAGAFRGVKDEITPSRSLIVSDYDETYIQIDVLVHFENAWVFCYTVNNQASYCKPADSNP